MSHPVRPSLHSRIRDLIPNADAAKLPREMTALLPDADADQVRESVGCMFRMGILDRVGTRSEGFRYFVVRVRMIAAKLEAAHRRQEQTKAVRELAKAARELAKAPRVETLDEYMARGGRVERLPPRWEQQADATKRSRLG